MKDIFTSWNIADNTVETRKIELQKGYLQKMIVEYQNAPSANSKYIAVSLNLVDDDPVPDFQRLKKSTICYLRTTAIISTNGGFVQQHQMIRNFFNYEINEAMRAWIVAISSIGDTNDLRAYIYWTDEKIQEVI